MHTDYVAEQRERQERVRQFATALADALTPEVEQLEGCSSWRLTEDREIASNCAYLDGPDDASLVLNFDRGRVEVRGVFPHHRDASPKRQVITVAQDRALPLIAADIRRRLLPGYLTELVRHRQAIKDADDYERQKKALQAELDAILPREAQVTSPTSVSFRFYGLSPEKARRILQVLAELGGA